MFAEAKDNSKRIKTWHKTFPYFLTLFTVNLRVTAQESKYRVIGQVSALHNANTTKQLNRKQHWCVQALEGKYSMQQW